MKNDVIKLSELTHFFEKQLIATETADKFDYTLYGGAAGPGKLIKDDSVILTPFGWKKGKDLEVGDIISNPDGSTQRIIQIKSRVVLPKWTVVFSDRTRLDVAEDHLWLAWKGSQSRIMQNKRTSGEKSAQIIETKTLKEWLDKGYSPQIPVCKEQLFSVHTNEHDSLDPYMLGLLLGDGTITKGYVLITCAEEDRKEYASILGEGWSCTTNKTIRAVGKIKKEIVKKLELYKLVGKKSNTKFIPRQYKLGSIKTRYAVVQGLMDTDGYSPSDEFGAMYYTVSPFLAEDMVFILRSLGAVVTVTERFGSYKKDGTNIQCKKLYTLYIKHRDKDKLFRLARKKANKKYKNISKSIVDIIVQGTVTGRCITVSNPNGLYITDDFIVTHNSYWLRWYPIRALIKWGKEYDLRGIHGALFCEDYPTLKDRQISKMETEFPYWLGEIKNTQEDGLGFHLRPEYGGHVLLLRNLDNPSKYLSSEFAIIAVDELTMNEEAKFHQLRSRRRWTGIPNPKFIAATNPGQIGHEWVKRRWIDHNFPLEENDIKDQFAYIRALPSDNPYLAESYIKTLQSLPEKLRKAYLEGNWDVFEGMYFSEWNKDIHVCEPFAIPESWVKIRGVDPSGRSGTTSSHIYAIDTEGTVWVIREHYISGLDADQHAQAITKMSEDFNIHYTVIDSSAFSKLGLPETMAEIYERNGVTGLVPASKDRVVGWNIVHQFLRWDKDIKPKLRIFSNCTHLARTIPLAIHNENKPEDISTQYQGAEHWDALDELRYVLQTLREQKSPRPLSVVERRLQELKERDEQFNYSYSR